MKTKRRVFFVASALLIVIGSSAEPVLTVLRVFGSAPASGV